MKTALLFLMAALAAPAAVHVWEKQELTFTSERTPKSPFGST